MQASAENARGDRRERPHVAPRTEGPQAAGRGQAAGEGGGDLAASSTAAGTAEGLDKARRTPRPTASTATRQEGRARQGRDNVAPGRDGRPRREADAGPPPTACTRGRSGAAVPPRAPAVGPGAARTGHARLTTRRRPSTPRRTARPRTAARPLRPAPSAAPASTCHGARPAAFSSYASSASSAFSAATSAAPRARATSASKRRRPLVQIAGRLERAAGAGVTHDQQSDALGRAPQLPPDFEYTARRPAVPPPRAPRPGRPPTRCARAARRHGERRRKLTLPPARPPRPRRTSTVDPESPEGPARPLRIRPPAALLGRPDDDQQVRPGRRRARPAASVQAARAASSSAAAPAATSGTSSGGQGQTAAATSMIRSVAARAPRAAGNLRAQCSRRPNNEPRWPASPPSQRPWPPPAPGARPRERPPARARARRCRTAAPPPRTGSGTYASSPRSPAGSRPPQCGKGAW